MLLDVAAGMPQPGSIVRVIGSSVAKRCAGRRPEVEEVTRLPGAFGATATQISDGELAAGRCGAGGYAERTANFMGFVTATRLPDAIAVDDVDVQLDAGTVVIGWDNE